MPWLHHWTSDNGKWNVFSYTNKFDHIDGVLTVVGEAVYVSLSSEHFDNPEHPSNFHVPFNEKAIKKIPKYVRKKAEELYKELNARFLETSFIVSKQVEYDHQRLSPGDQVERIEDWKKAQEGHYIARFKMTPLGEEIPLMMDEVVLIAEPWRPFSGVF